MSYLLGLGTAICRYTEGNEISVHSERMQTYRGGVERDYCFSPPRMLSNSGVNNGMAKKCPQRKRIKMTHEDGRVLVFDSISEAGEELGYSDNAFGQALRDNKKYGGWKVELL